MNNNPLRYTDPSGHSLWSTITGWFGLGGNKKEQKKEEYLSTEQIKKSLGSSSGNVPGLTSNVVMPNSSGYYSGSSSNPTQSSSSTLGESSGHLENAISGIKSFSTNAYNQTSAKFNNIYRSGYIDIGGSSKIYGPFVGGGGAQVNQKGYIPYVAGGIGLGGAGFTALFSEKPPQEHSTTINIQGTLPIVGNLGPAVNYSYPLDQGFIPLTSGEVTWGAGWGGGLSGTINHNFGIIK